MYRTREDTLKGEPWPCATASDGTFTQCIELVSAVRWRPQHVHGHGVAVGVAAFEQGQRQGVLDRVLDHPPQGPGPEVGVVAGLRQPVLGLVGDDQGQPAPGHGLGQGGDLDVHDPADVGLGQVTEADHLVDTRGAS